MIDDVNPPHAQSEELQSLKAFMGISISFSAISIRVPYEPDAIN